MTDVVTCDTSVLIPALVSWHPDHERARQFLATAVTALPAHVILECYSVLTQLPSGHRISAEQAATAIAHLSLPVLSLPDSALGTLVAEFARHGIRGGASYDGLVAVTAREHGAVLHSADVRAGHAYRALGVDLHWF